MSREFDYGSDWAPIYEQFTKVRGRTAEADDVADFLKSYADAGYALELGIGDGRLAVPLHLRGVKVEGIDNSDAMLERLAARVAGISAWKDDMSGFTAARRYALIYCAYNTFLLLSDRQKQVSCLRSSASVLDQGGHLVIELSKPDLDGYVGDQRISTLMLDHENAILRVALHNPLVQSIMSTDLWFSGDPVRQTPQRIRYVYHEELDTMAECAGLVLVNRWGDWNRGPFTKASWRHISVYKRGD